MNIEVANRFVELRKKNGLSQEQLAEKIGVSRQAVSKWERSEASPDTDNLILLARLYNISLDDLLNTEDEVPMPEKETEEEKAAESAETAQNDGFYNGDNNNYGENYNKNNGIHIEDDGDKVHIGFNGIHVDDKDGDKVHIGFNGIHVADKDGEEVHIGLDGIHIIDKNGENVHINEEDLKNGKGFYVNGEKVHLYFDNFGSNALKSFPWALLSIIAFLCCGFFLNGWYWAWTILLTIPLFYGTVSAISKRSFAGFPFLILTVIGFFALGYGLNAWHPGWVIFITIPLYHWAANLIDKSRFKRKLQNENNTFTV